MRITLLILLWLSFGNTFSQGGPNGPTEVTGGETQTYSYFDDVIFASPNWSATNASVTSTWQSGATYYANIYFTTDGTTTITFRDGGNVLGSLDVTVLTPPPPTPTASFSITYNCGNSVVSHGGPPGGANYVWYWQTSSTDTDISLGYSSSITRTSTGSLWLRARLSGSPYYWSNSSQSVGTITVNTTPPTAANAGLDQTGSATCGLTSVTLAANTPTVGTGSWSGTGGSFGNSLSPASTFSGTAGSTYTLTWTTSYGPCSSTDDVIIMFNLNPTTANAGPDQTGSATCGLTSVALSANAPAVGTGSWSIVSGAGGSLGNSASPTSTFSGTTGTTYALRWTISNLCSSSTDDVTVSFSQNPTAANAGPDQSVPATCGLPSTTLGANTPAVGTGNWSIASGTGGSLGNSSSPASTFSGTAGTTYVLRWTISNSPCISSDDVAITFNQNITSPNGPTGPTDVEVGETHTYTYTDDAVYTVNWQVTNGSVTNVWQSGANYNVDVYFNSGAGTARITFRDGSNPLGSLCVNVNATPPPTPDATFTTTYNCGNTLVSHGGPPSGNNYDWWWQDSSTGASTTLGNANNVTRASTANLWLSARLKNVPYTWSASAQPVGSVTVYSSAPAVPSVANNASRFGSGALTISVGTVSGALSYVWYTQSSGGTPISGQASETYWISNLAAAATYYVASKNGCESSQRLAVTATILQLPTLLATGTNGNSITMGQSVTLATSIAYATYSWKNSASAEVGTAATLTTSTPDNYTVTVTQAGVSNSGTSAPFAVVSGLAGQNMNYIIANAIQADNITDPNLIANLTVDDNSQTIQYFDGLGRPIQTVVTQGSPVVNGAGKKDIVQSMVYDGYGRESRKYLPVVINTSNGWHKAGLIDVSGNYAGAAADFYNNSSDKIADDAKPLAETIFEPSPLNRVLKQGAPGAVWQPNNPGGDIYSMNDKTVKKRYESNQANEVFLFTYDPATGLVSLSPDPSTRFYSANQLYANKTYDEHASDNTTNEVIEYIDKLGRVVCKKVYVKTVNSVKKYASTYYIYDDFGNLVVVLPPEGVNSLTSQY